MNQRPRINLLLSAIDKRMEIAGLIFLAISWLLAINGLFTYPEVIPVHFNADGIPDGYGNKFYLLILPVISTVIWIGITFLNNNPHIFNYPVTVTDENAEEMYRSATRLMRVIKSTVALLFLLILFMTHRVVTGQSSGIGKGFLFIALAMMILPAIFYIIKMAVTTGREKNS